MKNIILLLGFCYSTILSAASCTNDLNPNPNMNGTLGGVQVANSWFAISGTPDINAGGPLYTNVTGYDWIGTPVDSHDSGTWQSLNSNGNLAQPGEEVGLNLSGLEIGKEYTVTLEYATTPIQNPRYAPTTVYDDLGYLILKLDGVEFDTTATSSAAWTWEYDTLSFVATNTTHTLSVELTNTAKTYMSFDSFSVCEAIVTNYGAAKAIPSLSWPGLLVLFGLMGFFTRKQLRKL